MLNNVIRFTVGLFCLLGLPSVVISGECGPGGCPTPYGVGVRGGYGQGIQAGVLGGYGGVVGAQVGPGPRVQAGVVPGTRPTAPGVQRIPGVVRIQSRTPGGTKHGTGTLIDVAPGDPGNPWVVLTCAHILTDQPRAEVNGQWVAMRIVAIDPLHDVAILERAEYRPIPAKAMPVVSQAPQSAGWQGFAFGSRLVGGGGPVSHDNGLLCVPGKAEEGTSGGPIYGQGGIVSIITEVNDRGTNQRQWWTCGPDTRWLRAWIMAAVGNGASGGVVGSPPSTADDDVAPPVPDTGRLPARPVVSVEQYNNLQVTVEKHGTDIGDLKSYLAAQNEINEKLSGRLGDLESRAQACTDWRASVDVHISNQVSVDQRQDERLAAVESRPSLSAEDLQLVQSRLDNLEAFVRQPLTVRTYYGNKLQQTEEAYLGGMLDFYLVPVPKKSPAEPKAD